MKNLSKLVFLAVAAIMLIATVAVLTPRVAHAVAAALVQDIDSPPRNAWTGSCSFPPTPDYSDVCAISVPAGQVVTIQTVTFKGNTVGHKNILLTLGTLIGTESVSWNNQISNIVEEYGVPKTSPPTYSFASSLNLTLYATQNVYASITTDGPQPANVAGAGLGGTVLLVGYSVNVGTPSTN